MMYDSFEGRGRYYRGRPCFTPLKEFGLAADGFPGQLNLEEIDQFRVMTDF
jgi:hypothetical protein